MKKCKICKQNKLLSEFPTAVTTRDKKDIYCRLCKKLAQKSWYRSSGAKSAKNGYDSNRAMRKVSGMLHRAKKRSKLKGLVFEIIRTDLAPIPLVCPVLGISLNWNRAGLPAGDSPSLDRRDNRLGYVPGNVQIISHRANMIKCDATAEEVRAVAIWMA